MLSIVAVPRDVMVGREKVEGRNLGERVLCDAAVLRAAEIEVEVEMEVGGLDSLASA